MSRVYWDSMLFIYWIEDHPKYAPRLARILEKMRERDDTLCTSTFTVGEVLSGAYKRNDSILVARIRELFADPEIETMPFTTATADTYASIRARLGLSPADAIHLASAAEASTDVFLTNDNALVGKRVPGIQFVAKIDTDLF
jgi:predicted nucleic acid-binding protein